MKTKVTVVLVQYYNPCYSNNGVTEKETAPNTYKVEKVTNSLKPNIGQMLLPSEVQTMIDQGWTVNIQPVK